MPPGLAWHSVLPRPPVLLSLSPSLLPQAHPLTPLALSSRLPASLSAHSALRLRPCSPGLEPFLFCYRPSLVRCVSHAVKYADLRAQLAALRDRRAPVCAPPRSRRGAPPAHRKLPRPLLAERVAAALTSVSFLGFPPRGVPQDVVSRSSAVPVLEGRGRWREARGPRLPRLVPSLEVLSMPGGAWPT